ncbi:MAG: tRNA (5-methylaminomethyl-2-thiouridine)(34)-methyltransferase MnmD [Bacteroidales bacterium]|nr:tRNA (5-methylaminomethyl-2-thiouridine)(34)-methyltransferase MnmD [Bacteroidales bacterium]
MEKPAIIITDDGSHSIFNEVLNEHYHSKAGAISESKHVYIENGLLLLNKSSVNIFEFGFGSGLNALLTYQYANYNNLIINYITIEKYPVSSELIHKLNYPALLSLDNKIFEKMHESAWNQAVKISENFYLHKFKDDLVNFDFNNLPLIDIVYYDAFSPSKQAELWTEELFRKIYRKMNLNGLLTTYSSAGIVKRALRAAGFKVIRKPGAHGKFHMLNAFKN